MDRRFYQRIKINRECVLIYRDYNKNISFEINAIVKDICEEGIGFQIIDKDDKIKFININDEIHFSFIDTYNYYNTTEKNEIVTGKAKIVRIENNPDMIFGCVLIPNDNLNNYIKERKISNYLRYYLTKENKKE